MREVGAPVLGAIFRPQFPPERLPAALKAAEETGLAELWLWEDCFLEGGLTTASVALARTSHLTVGLGLMPVPLRNVAIAAMEIATIARLFPDRSRIAVGHGVQDWMRQVGAGVESPMTLMREYLAALKALLDGRPVTVAGRYVALDDVALDWPPLRRPKLLMGATGPKSMALCGELADGVVITEDATPAVVAEGVSRCRDARRTAGIEDPFEVVVYLRAYAGPDGARQLQHEERPHAVGAGVAGGTPEIAERVLTLADAGAGTVCLLPSSEEADPKRYIDEVVLPVQQALGTQSA